MSRAVQSLSTVAAVTLFLLTQHAPAQEATSLSYKPQLDVGSKYRSEIEVQSDQTLTLAGMPLETHSDTFLVAEETVVDRTDSGGWKFEGGFTQVQSDMELPGGLKVNFNSNNPDQAEAAAPLSSIVDALKATAGARWITETNAGHKITAMEYIDDPFADVDPLLKGNSDPEAITRNRQTELNRYPEETVKPGDSWTRVEESDIGGGQTLTFEKEYTYSGTEERDGKTFDKVTVKVLTVDYEMDDNSPSPAKVTDSDLQVESSDGTYWYDRTQTIFSELSETVRMTGSLTLEVNGQKLPGELDLTISTASKVNIASP